MTGQRAGTFGAWEARVRSGRRLPFRSPAAAGAAGQPLRRTDTKATLVRFKAADGTSLDGVLVGSGPAGVVLAHEYPPDLCWSARP